MSLPNFTAESALYKTRGYYWASHAPIGAGNVTVCQLPDGSYQQTCLECFLSPPDPLFGSQDLICHCLDFNGRLVATTLPGAVGTLGCYSTFGTVTATFAVLCSARM